MYIDANDDNTIDMIIDDVDNHVDANDIDIDIINTNINVNDNDLINIGIDIKSIDI